VLSACRSTYYGIYEFIVVEGQTDEVGLNV